MSSHARFRCCWCRCCCCRCAAWPRWLGRRKGWVQQRGKPCNGRGAGCVCWRRCWQWWWWRRRRMKRGGHAPRGHGSTQLARASGARAMRTKHPMRLGARGRSAPRTAEPPARRTFLSEAPDMGEPRGGEGARGQERSGKWATALPRGPLATQAYA
ncbi:MAG: hypothetical protein J3K34DRAFT_418494 [Monoraphidium minutum]|nr:MAG: hypothetical protein J3K34DRAFT_418494 [Monoraphidium minutum]